MKWTYFLYCYLSRVLTSGTWYIISRNNILNLTSLLTWLHILGLEYNNFPRSPSNRKAPFARCRYPPGRSSSSSSSTYCYYDRWSHDWMCCACSSRSWTSHVHSNSTCPHISKKTSGNPTKNRQRSGTANISHTTFLSVIDRVAGSVGQRVNSSTRYWCLHFHRPEKMASIKGDLT